MTIRGRGTRPARRSRSASRRSRTPHTGTRSHRVSVQTSTIMHLLDPGDHVVCVNDVYGGTYRMFSQVYEPKGYRFTYATPEQRPPSRRRTSPTRGSSGSRRRPTRCSSRRHRGGRSRDEGGGRAARRRQHVRHTVPAESALPRRGHRPSLHDEVPRGPFGRGRGVRRHERPDDRGAPAVCRSPSAPSPAHSTPGWCCAG